MKRLMSDALSSVDYLSSARFKYQLVKFRQRSPIHQLTLVGGTAAAPTMFEVRKRGRV